MGKKKSRLRQENEPVKENWNFVIFAIIGGVVFYVMALYFANYCRLHYDEIFTYLYYVHDWAWWENLPNTEAILANNHLLNTLLITFFDRLTKNYYSEFLIRLPSLIFLGVYIVMAAILARKQKVMPFWCFTLLLFNIMFFNFAIQGRGYGMAATMILVGGYFYYRWREQRENNWWLAAAGLSWVVGCYANTITLLPMAALVVTIGWNLLQEKKLWSTIKKCWWWLIGLGVVMAPALAWHVIVSLPGKPYFDRGPSYWTAIWEGYAYNLIQNWTVAFWVAVGVAIVAGVTAIFWRQKIARSYWFLPVLIYLLICALIQLQPSGAYPRERALLPAYPLLALGFWEITVWWTAKNAGGRKICEVILVVFLMVIFVWQLRDNAYLKKEIPSAVATEIPAQIARGKYEFDQFRTELAYRFYADKYRYYYGQEIPPFQNIKK